MSRLAKPLGASAKDGNKAIVDLLDSHEC